MKLKFALLAVLAIAALTLSAGAQNTSKVTAFTNPANTTGLPDTISNSGTTYLASRIFGSGTMAIQLNIVKVSGTVGGSASLQASIDNGQSPTTWFAIPGTDTLTLADATQVKSWVIPANYLHYRIRITTSGTQKNAPKAFYYLQNQYK